MEPRTVAGVLARLKKRPDDAELFQLLGKLYLKGGKLKEARKAYERSLVLDPKDPFTHLYLGNWLFHVGKPRQALKSFKVAAKFLPENAIVYDCQGDIYRAQGRDDLAEEAYETAVRVAPRDRLARQKLSEWYTFRYGENEVAQPGKTKRRRRSVVVDRAGISVFADLTFVAAGPESERRRSAEEGVEGGARRNGIPSRCRRSRA